MKILLAHKGSSPDKSFDKTPLAEHLREQNIEANGIRSIYAYLKSLDYDIEFANFSNDHLASILKKIKDYSPQVIGFTCYTINRHTIFTLCKAIKSLFLWG